MPLVPGHLVNQRYEIRALIGPDGPMEVYRALDLRMGRDIALAVLELSGMHDPMSLLRFEAAAQIRGRMRHPNLTTLHDFGHDGSKVFIAAEWMPGESLRRRINRSPMDWQEARMTALALLRVVMALRENGIEAKDLDSSGVHLERTGNLKLLAYWVEPVSEPRSAAAPPGNAPLLDIVRLTLEMVSERRKTAPTETLAKLEEWAATKTPRAQRAASVPNSC